jgi:hypothetical protein
MIFVGIDNGLNNLSRALAAGCVVKVDQRAVAVHQPAEYWKIGPVTIGIENGRVYNCRHE